MFLNKKNQANTKTKQKTIKKVIITKEIQETVLTLHKTYSVIMNSLC